MVTITASVGRLGGVNRQDDVKKVQSLLNKVLPSQGGPSPTLVVDGICGPKTIAAIQKFQLHHFGWPGADGRVDPNGQTLQKLNQLNLSVPLPSIKESFYCGTGDSRNQGLAHGIEQAFLSAVAVYNKQGSALKDAPSSSSALWKPSLPSLPSFTHLSSAQEIVAKGIYGSSLDFSRIFISDKKGVDNRAFVIAIGALGLVVQVMNLGTFSPSSDVLIHELCHVWQSQHHFDPYAFMGNAGASLLLALRQNKDAAKTDPTITTHKAWPGSYPFSAYAWDDTKLYFSDHAAEQIANQIEKGVVGIIKHVKSVGIGAIDPDNIKSLSWPQVEDRRNPNIKY